MFGGGDLDPTQLQLFGVPFSSSDNTDAVNNTGNNFFTSTNQSNMRLNQAEYMRDSKLRIALNTFGQDVAEQVAVANPTAVSTGLKLSYEDDEHNSSITTASGSISSNSMVISLRDHLRNEIERQKQEVDRYISAQEEQLTKSLKEANQRHMLSIISAVEREVGKKLQSKDLEVESMKRKNKELIDQIKQVEVEVHSWQSRALYNESVVNTLKAKLTQAVAQAGAQAREGYGDSEGDEVASYNLNGVPGGFFQSNLLSSGTSSQADVDQMACRSCRSKEAMVLLMPCRHLCLCEDCDRFVMVCPICQSMKSASFAVNMS